MLDSVVLGKEFAAVAGNLAQISLGSERGYFASCKARTVLWKLTWRGSLISWS